MRSFGAFSHDKKVWILTISFRDNDFVMVFRRFQLHFPPPLLSTCLLQISTRQEALMLEDEAASVCSMPYRPPELMSVKRESMVDERVDVWSLGCTLYAMAFGHSPFETPR